MNQEQPNPEETYLRSCYKVTERERIGSPDNTTRLGEIEESAKFVLVETDDDQQSSLLHTKGALSFCGLSRLAAQEPRQESFYFKGRCKIPALDLNSLSFVLNKIESVFVLTIYMAESEAGSESRPKL